MSNLTPTTKKALQAPLDPAVVNKRKQGGTTVDYVEGWWAISEANRIFGFDGWTRETVEMRMVSERERKIGRDQRDGWGVTYTAKVRVTALGVTREGTGSGHGIGVDLGEAHESAVKEAETDAMKRALMTFGNPFGLALYDKSRANVRADDGRLTKSEARDAATKINNLIDTSNTVEELDARWSQIEDQYIGKLPNDWEPALYQKYETKRDGLQAVAA